MERRNKIDFTELNPFSKLLFLFLGIIILLISKQINFFL